MNKKREPLLYSISVTLGLLSLQFKEPFFDSDILWSIATGKWIFMHRALPVVDPFSWSILGKEWITHEWLYCLSAYALHLKWGTIGLYLLALFPMIITAYFLYLICHNYSRENSYAFLLVLTTGLFMLYKLASPFRAYNYALLCFTILIYLMYFKRKTKWDFLYFGLLFMLWANLHVSVCMGIVILVVEMTRRMIASWNIQGLGIMLFSALSTLANPYAYRIWSYFLFTLTGMGVSKYIAEWKAPDFNNLIMLLMYLLLAVYVILSHFESIRDNANRLLKKSEINQLKIGHQEYLDKLHAVWGEFRSLVGRITPTTCILVLFWAFYIYALHSFRMIYYAIIMWIIVAAFFMGQKSKQYFAKPTYSLIVGFFAIIFILNVAISNPKDQNITTINNKVSPVEEVQFLKENPQFQTHLFNGYLYGGYLILNNIPVFIDARSDSYIKFGVQQNYVDAIFLLSDPQRILDQYGVENILIEKATAFDIYLGINPTWHLIYEGPSARLFSRTDSNVSVF